MQRTQQTGFDSALVREQMMGGGVPLSPKNLDEQAERDEEEIAEVEMILETYFMSVDNTFNKLQTLCEYIDDTEVRIWAHHANQKYALHCQPNGHTAASVHSMDVCSVASRDQCRRAFCTSRHRFCPHITAMEKCVAPTHNHIRPASAALQDYINIELDNHRNQLIRVCFGLVPEPPVACHRHLSI